ncbi:4Fe-4S binding protein [Synergistaceae bacterium OttesenSCG-928-I11]|nr:4Fe-4S binding protein [Synergistaceae bacterium OttesenSCG-928-I11]
MILSSDVKISKEGVGMNLLSIGRYVRELLETSMENRVSEDVALRPDLVSMQMYGDVLFGVAEAGDEIFERFRARHVVGPQFRKPDEWLPGAANVISVFFSFTEQVAASNVADPGRPSDEWLHARFEGQHFIDRTMNALKGELGRHGYDAVVPSGDARFENVRAPENGKWDGASYTSNWSERHVAFACGLGTFGLSAGLITEHGMAGRFGSVVTSLRLEPTVRGYSEPYEYCTQCGVCVKRCPVGAISRESGKDHTICARLVDESKKKFAPRYGCGKCQVAVPCQKRAPGARG